MNENERLAEAVEATTRIAELSEALADMTGLRDDAVNDMNAALTELEASKVREKVANARSDRYLTHLQDGVEL